jgi:hypothetical protein
MKKPVKKENGQSPTSMEQDGTRQAPSEEDIRLLAYAIFEAKGKSPGHDLDDWLQAEKELVQGFGQSRL